MALWNDIIDPATLTGYVRESLADLERRRGNLARFLPNRAVPSINVRFVAGQSGLVPEASFRTYDAEPDVGKRQPVRRVTLELPPIGITVPITEYDQLRARGASDDVVLGEVLATARSVVQAVADRIERLRGVVLRTGVATIPEIGAADSFGRTAGHTTAADTPWNSSTAVSRIADLQTWADLYEDTNGVAPGVILTSRKVLRTIAAGDEFQVSLTGGGSRPGTVADVNAIIEGQGLPPIEVYSRRTASGRVLDEDEILMLPAPVDPDDWAATQLGATFWGQTLSATEPAWAIEDVDWPGIVAATFRAEKPPMIAEVVADAIGMPVLANADLSLAAVVLGDTESSSSSSSSS